MRNEQQLVAWAILCAALLAAGGCGGSTEPAPSAPAPAPSASAAKIATPSGIDMVRIPAASL